MVWVCCVMQTLSAGLAADGLLVLSPGEGSDPREVIGAALRAHLLADTALTLVIEVGPRSWDCTLMPRASEWLAGVELREVIVITHTIGGPPRCRRAGFDFGAARGQGVGGQWLLV